MILPVVAIIGRPNVGKSTLFNRIIKRQRAIVGDIPGITRDRIYHKAFYDGHSFILVDTGGIIPDSDEPLERHITNQALVAFEEADLTIILFDVREGVTPSDAVIMDISRKHHKPVLFVLNKAERDIDLVLAHEFHGLGINEFFTISAAHGLGIDDLLESVVRALPEVEDEEEDPDLVKIAVIGKPNVGKSSLINRLLGSERLLVSEKPGTTRDSVDTLVEHEGSRYLFIDTAGIRRKKNITYQIEKFSILRSLRSIDRSDIVILMIAGNEPISDQDLKVGSYAHQQGKGAIIAVNKYDLIDRVGQPLEEMRKDIREQLSFIAYAPLQFISAKFGRRVVKLFEEIERINQARKQTISTSRLNDELQNIIKRHPPPLTNSHQRLRLNYITQISNSPPTFIVFCNNPHELPEHYRRYVLNCLSAAFPFYGNPIKIQLKKKN